MRRAGRIPGLTPHTYVLTAAEVARLYFRRGPGYVNSGQVFKDNPTFPRPRPDGLFHRSKVQAWVDSTFGFTSGLEQQAREDAIMEAAINGARQDATRGKA